MSNKVTTGLLTMALALSFVNAIDMSEAEAAERKRKNLLEILFPKATKRAEQRKQRERMRQFATQQVERKKVAPPIQKVKGASYYTYKVEGFRALKLAGIITAASKVQPVIENTNVEMPTIESTQTTAEFVASDMRLSPDLIATNSIVEEKSIIKDIPVDMGHYISSEVVTISRVEVANIIANTNNLGAIETATEALLVEPIEPIKITKGPHILTSAGLSKVELRAESKLLLQLEKHYSANPEFIWINHENEPKQIVEAILNVFETADAYGLDPKNYQLRSVDQLIENGYSREEAATQFEMSLSASVLRYMADAHSGAINPNKISGYHDFSTYKRDYKKHLANLIAADLPVNAIFDAHPKNSHFKNLKSELEMLLERKHENTLEPIAAGTLLKPGNVSAELPKVIAAVSKFGSKEFLTENSDFLSAYDGSQIYDDATVAFLKAYQADKKLKPDGIVGSQTLRTLKVVSVRSKITKINLAMERLRWLPNNFGKRHVFINQPAYQARYVVNGKAQLSMRVIVGKKANQTNFFYDTIESVEFNPYWNVPRSILVNEKLSRLQADPYYYQARGFEIMRHGGKAVDPGSINWYDVSSTKKYYIRQLPGARNALGELKILFPNKHNIYMHDTPSRSLFKRNKRALSHGCIRLHKPRAMAAAVMGTSVKKINGYVNAGKNLAMRVPNKLPVYVSYFTAFPRNNGNIGYYADIYGRDIALTKALKANSVARKRAITS